MKYALLIGINYYDTESELRGCKNDILNIKKLLLEKYEFLEENIVMLLEKEEKYRAPTKENILNELNKIKTLEISKLWIHYSGHGSYIRDLNGDDKDGRDECICPVDYDQNGFIVDDELAIIFGEYPANMNIIVIFDCCHSGTALDLKYLYTGKTYVKQNNNKFKAQIVFLSGCKDNQTSADAFINSKSQGAMTASLLEVLKFYNYKLTLKTLIKGMHVYMTNNNFDQIPQLCVSSKKISIDVDFQL